MHRPHRRPSWPQARDALAAYLAGTRDDPGDWPGLAVFADARRFTARHASILLAFEAAAEAAALAAPRRCRLRPHAALAARATR